MTIELGQDPMFLIFLSFLEILLITIPVFLSSLIKKKNIKEEFKEIGFRNFYVKKLKFINSIILSLAIGFGFYVLSMPLSLFLLDFLIPIIFGIDFVRIAISNTINTTPINPSPIELLILVLLQIVIVAPCEEGFFRGFLISKLSSKWRKSLTVLFSSSIFSIYHIPPFIVPFQTVISFFGYYFFFGIFLSILFIENKGVLLPCIIAHSSFNILILILN